MEAKEAKEAKKTRQEAWNKLFGLPWTPLLSLLASPGLPWPHLASSGLRQPPLGIPLASPDLLWCLEVPTRLPFPREAEEP